MKKMFMKRLAPSYDVVFLDMIFHFGVAVMNIQEWPLNHYFPAFSLNTLHAALFVKNVFDIRGGN